MTHIVDGSEQVICVRPDVEENVIFVDYCKNENHFIVQLTPKEAKYMSELLLKAYESVI